MNKCRIYIVWIYALLAFLFFGGMLCTIITQYPNWDYDLPNSLVTTNNFYSEANPGTFFQLMGKIMVPVFIVMIVIIWKLSQARNYFLIHFITYLIIGLGTGIIVYPILYELGAENVANRPIEEIQALLDRFKTLDSIRSVLALISILFLVLGLVEFHKKYFSLN